MRHLLCDTPTVGVMSLQFIMWLLFFLHGVLGQSPTQSPATGVPVLTSNPTVLPTFDFTVNTTSTTTPTLSPINSPTIRPTEQPTRVPTSLPTVLPTVSHEPSHVPSPLPSASPTRTYRPTHSPTQSPTAFPTESAAPSPSPSDKPSAFPTSTVMPSNRPSASHTPSLSPAPTNAPSADTMSPTASPTLLPSQRPTPLPTVVPSLSPTEKSDEDVSRLFLVVRGMTRNISSPEGSGIPKLTAEFEAMTSHFIQDFWKLEYLSPIVLLSNVSTSFVNETRLKDTATTMTATTTTMTIYQSSSSSFSNRYLQTGDTNGTTTNSTDGGDGTPSQNTTSPDNNSTADNGDGDGGTSNTTQSTALDLLMIEFRSRVPYRVLDRMAAEERYGADFVQEHVILLRPFDEGLYRYANLLANLVQSEQILEIVNYGQVININTGVPTVAPTLAPVVVSTTAPTNLIVPQPPSDQQQQDEDRKLIASVSVIVGVSVCLAAGYLYYLVRKEDRQPIIGNLPEDLSGQDYFIETPGHEPASLASPDSAAALRPSSSLPEDGGGGGGGMLRSEEEIGRSSSLHGSRHSSMENLRDTTLPAGTMTTFTTSLSELSTKGGPPPMAVLDDVPGEGGDFLRRRNSGGTGSNGNVIEGMDQVEANASFDSGEGSGAVAPFDMTGFQMDVQNLDDV